MRKSVSMLLGFIICMIDLAGQSQEITFLGAAGGIQQSGGHFVSWSIGEPLVSYRLQSAHWLTEGMQQPGVLSVVTGTTYAHNALHIRVFPNPAADVLHIALDNTVTCMDVSIVNMLGQKMHDQIIPNDTVLAIDLGRLQPGIYLLRVQCADARVFVQSFIKV